MLRWHDYVERWDGKCGESVHACYVYMRRGRLGGYTICAFFVMMGMMLRDRKDRIYRWEERIEKHSKWAHVVANKQGRPTYVDPLRSGTNHSRPTPRISNPEQTTPNL